jgi:SWI/SNF-related matrix-associated actin-dependent regulator 1 of chromatin subfamily A
MDGKRLFDFQNAGVRFIERSGGRVLLGDEMGLGKTIQALAFLILHPEARPFLWIGKGSLLYQYQHEVMRWGGEDWFTQVIETSKDRLLPGFIGYTVSYDLLRKLTTKEKSFVDQVTKLGIKTIVLDECQQIKNSESQRTMFTRALARVVPNVIALSGTPIKNHAAEYFPILNILNPQMFPREANFVRYECDSYFNGYGYKTGGLRDPERFLAKTKNFIIRREREEVMPDLPKIQRQFQLHEMGADVERAYVEAFKMFRNEYNKGGDSSMGSFDEASNILAYLSRMRHLTGLAKIDPCIDNVMEFLGSTERKMTIFHHHTDVGDILEEKLTKVLLELGLARPLRITRDDKPEVRYEKVLEFTNNPLCRILIASTLASGEGLNLQVCSDCLMLERQWNPANEEQAEARFPRPGSTATSIAAIYLVAVGTVDEFFSEIVERKREIVTSTLGGEAVEWDQSSIMKELAAVLAANGGQRWKV